MLTPPQAAQESLRRQRWRLCFVTFGVNKFLAQLVAGLALDAVKNALVFRGSQAYCPATMINMDDETRKNVLGEVIYDELRIIREYLEDIPIIKERLTNVEKDVTVLKTDMVAVKAWLKEHDSRFERLEVRFGAFEAKLDTN